MAHWIETHGIECIVSYLMFAAFVGSMPTLPENAGYWSRWGYGFLHLASMNLRSAFQLMKLNVPDPPKE